MNMRDVTILRDYRQKTWHFDWRFAPAYPILQAKVAKCPRAPGRAANRDFSPQRHRDHKENQWV